MKSKCLALLLILASSFACVPMFYVSKNLVGSNLDVTITSVCGKKPLKNTIVSVFLQEKKIYETTTDANGLASFTLRKPGIYFLEMDFKGSGYDYVSDYKIDFRTVPKITVSRQGNNYKICTNVDVNILYIDDNKKGFAIPLKNKCAYYATDSKIFRVRIKGTKTIKSADFNAGKLLFVEMPYVVKTNRNFVVRVLENNKPVKDAVVTVAKIKSKTNPQGYAQLKLSEAGIYRLKAEKEGFVPFVSEIIAAEEQPLIIKSKDVIEPNSVFIVNVRNLKDEALEGALVQINGIKRSTDYYGNAAFVLTEEGTYKIKVTYKGLEAEKEVKVIETKVPKPKKLYVSAPDEIFENAPYVISVSSDSGPVKFASVEIDSKLYKTDERGFLTLKGLSPGKHALYISAPGYIPFSKQFVVKKFTKPKENKFLLTLLAIAFAFTILLTLYGIYRVAKKRWFR